MWRQELAHRAHLQPLSVVSQQGQSDGEKKTLDVDVVGVDVAETHPQTFRLWCQKLEKQLPQVAANVKLSITEFSNRFSKVRDMKPDRETKKRKNESEKESESEKDVDQSTDEVRWG